MALGRIKQLSGKAKSLGSRTFDLLMEKNVGTKWTDHCEARLTDMEFQSRGLWHLPQNPWEAVGDIVAQKAGAGAGGGRLRLEGRESCELHLVRSLTYLSVHVWAGCALGNKAACPQAQCSI